MNVLKHGLKVLLMLVCMHNAQAALTIQITEGTEGALPIAVVPFALEASAAGSVADFSDVIRADLARSGRFRPMPVADMVARPTQGSDVRFSDWRLLGQDNLAIGRIRPRGDGRFEVLFQLFDVFKGQQLAGYSIPFAAGDARRVAHRISDIIYEKLTGQKGAFTTRIAYITALNDTDGKKQFRLNIADADGFNEQTILTSPEPLMSPSWSPDGNRLAYVSFESGRPQVFVQEVFTGKRQPVTSFPGLNSAPAWSPDARYLAMALSKDGNPEIYLFELATSRLSRLTNHRAIDTEPAWAPDGRSLVFTSDRGGRPQLYRLDLSGTQRTGLPRRLTFEGDYNARGVYSEDGEKLAMVHGNGGRFQIAVLEIKTGLLRVLTNSRLDESPSFAPNDSMIIYATEHAGRGVLSAVSVDGRVHQRLEVQAGDVREPSWSPYND